MQHERDKVLKFFKLIYLDHLYFTLLNGIGAENPTKLVDLHPERHQSLKAAVIELICNESTKRKLQSSSEAETCNFVDLVGEQTVEIIRFVRDFLTEMLRQRVASSAYSISSSAHVVFARTLFFDSSTPLYVELTKKALVALQGLPLKNESCSDTFVSLIIQRIFVDLAKEEELA